MDPKVKADASRRLSYAEGHLSGIKRMVDEEKYCVDILKQTYAVRRAIQKVEAVILQGHLETHVVEGVREGRESEVLNELLELYSLQERN